MPDVWYAIPTANPAKCSATFMKWQRMGYRTAALVDGDVPRPANCDRWWRVSEYKGWPWASNTLCRLAMEENPATDWIVCGGDDMDPDPKLYAAEIAMYCQEHFSGTLGVMQPTGDPWGVDASGRSAAERICGSPWLGREWIQRAYMGKGPWCEEYGHFYCDEELYEITQAMGLLWQRKDLTHFHHHWHRTGQKRPAHMTKAESRWIADKRVFQERKAMGFPGSGLSESHRPHACPQ